MNLGNGTRRVVVGANPPRGAGPHRPQARPRPTKAEGPVRGRPKCHGSTPATGAASYAKENAMYLSVGVVLVIAVLILSPLLWVAWWALAGLGEQAGGSYSDVHHVQPA